MRLNKPHPSPARNVFPAVHIIASSFICLHIFSELPQEIAAKILPQSATRFWVCTLQHKNTYLYKIIHKYYITLHYITLHYITLHYITLRGSVCVTVEEFNKVYIIIVMYWGISIFRTILSAAEDRMLPKSFYEAS